jgi:hypothetical protein
MSQVLFRVDRPVGTGGIDIAISLAYFRRAARYPT